MATRSWKSPLGRRILGLLAGSVLSLSLLAFASGGLNGAKVTTAEIAPANKHNIAVADHQQNRTRLLETEIVTVTRRGFEPTAITRSQGEFILMIENPNRQELNFTLSRKNGPNLHDVRASRDAPDWNELQDLQPGEYELTERSHPEWKCLITITSR
jgi:hypothetical protein